MRHYSVGNEIETFLVSCPRHCISRAFTKKKGDLSRLNVLVTSFPASVYSCDLVPHRCHTDDVVH